jgi:hypothetical protein
MTFARDVLGRTIFMHEGRETTSFHHFTRLYLITMLDKLNRAKYLYDEATNEETRQEADKMFADYYDWFTQQQIPIIYDQTIHRWLFHS